MKIHYRFASYLAVMALLGGAVTPSAWAADYAYKVTMTLISPKGTAGEKLATSQPTSTKTSPCSDSKQDQVTISVTYDAGKTATEKRDLYLILQSPSGGLFPLKKYPLGSSPTMSGPFTPATLIGSVASNIYLPAADNLGQGAQSETVLGGYINLESIATGTWQLAAIIANANTVDFDDPSSWAAWDVTTLMVGKPWTGTYKTACTTGFLP
jgi:hypothetical protein